MEKSRSPNYSAEKELWGFGLEVEFLYDVTILKNGILINIFENWSKNLADPFPTLPVACLD